MVKIEIDGIEIKAGDGDMDIEAADAAGIYIPRFCYHKKLSVAANCRMCLVEVEKARKPLPACATPVTDGMKVSTKSKNALAAQKGVMEFLLINHPLDCPICDQGGECELQDVAMGYGNDVSRFSETKRVVFSKNIGPLISTDMTRCIHCTRCVRFGDEIAGIKELGATGRGEHMSIGTYIEKSVDSEMSGNVIDLCPVGALTSKPFRYHARAWEMQQRDSIAAHDCVGSNTFLHTRQGVAMRVVPADNEAINETWISDRDRYSYQGLNSEDRLLQPMVKENGQWQETDWETALNKAFTAINKALNSAGAEQIGVLASPNATTEEHYLLQKLARSQGINNLDHRLRQTDFASQAQQAAYLSLGMGFDELEHINAGLFVGANLRKDQPIVGHRVRKAAMHGAAVSLINTYAQEVKFKTTANIAASPSAMISELAGVLKAAIEQNKSANVSANAKKVADSASVNDQHRAIAASLIAGTNSVIVIGSQATMHPVYAGLESLASAIATATQSKLAYLTDGANAAGAALSGMLPHRLVAGKNADTAGMNARQMIEANLNTYVLLNAEPEFDFADAAATVGALQNAENVVALTAYDSETLRECADVMLPTTPYTESAGTFINIAGISQSFNGCVPPKGEARPAWKVIRVLANLFEASGFEYISVEDVLNEIEEQVGEVSNVVNPVDTEVSVPGENGLMRVGGVAIYGGDAVVRRAPALQATADAKRDRTARMNSETAKANGLAENDTVNISQSDNEVDVTVMIDDAVANNCVLIPMGTEISAQLGGQNSTMTLTKNVEEMRASNA
ncbi:MAG: NADH-quinone oxidoreductase subunit NuoG [Gammaproteobacteria bacterium]|nr:NADH-quinone oxidoreductase subunit NuoG [Gammaproteobacteria bacterium]